MYVTQGLHRSLQRRPDAIATVCAGRTRTHRESVDRIARLAGALRGLGVGVGDRVAILSLNSDRYHEALAATAWAGGVVVPVNIRWALPEIAASLTEVDARLLLVDDTFASMVPAVRCAHPGLTHVLHLGDGAAPDGASVVEQLIDSTEPVDDVRRSGSDPAAICYTGGTTSAAGKVLKRELRRPYWADQERAVH